MKWIKRLFCKLCKKNSVLVCYAPPKRSYNVVCEFCGKRWFDKNQPILLLSEDADLSILATTDSMANALEIVARDKYTRHITINGTVVRCKNN